MYWSWPGPLQRNQNQQVQKTVLGPIMLATEAIWAKGQEFLC